MPSDFTGTIAGDRHYSTGTIEGYLLYPLIARVSSTNLPLPVTRHPRRLLKRAERFEETGGGRAPSPSSSPSPPPPPPAPPLRVRELRSFPTGSGVRGCFLVPACPHGVAGQVSGLIRPRAVSPGIVGMLVLLASISARIRRTWPSYSSWNKHGRRCSTQWTEGSSISTRWFPRNETTTLKRHHPRTYVRTSLLVI